MPRVALFPISNESADGSDTKAVAFFEKKYRNRAEVKVLKQTNKRVLVQISGLRGEVISGGYWETLIISCVFSSDTHRIEFFLNTTGRYATGVGSSRPAENSFKDMDQEYYEPLQHYSDGLATELQKQLGG